MTTASSAGWDAIAGSALPALPGLRAPLAAAGAASPRTGAGFVGSTCTLIAAASATIIGITTSAGSTAADAASGSSVAGAAVCGSSFRASVFAVASPASVVVPALRS